MSRPRVHASTLLLGTLLVAAIILAYQPAWHAGFIWDDDDYVTHNPLLSAPDGLHRIWFSTDSPSQYFPLTYTTFRLQYSLWDLNPAGYHWFNILLHAANSLLLWRLLHQLFRSLPSSAAPSFHSSPLTLHSFLPAALFALHPIQVESVAWITELKNIQSLFFFLLSLLAWLSFLNATQSSSASFSVSAVPSCKTLPSSAASNARWPVYTLSLLFCAFALFSKTTACTLPAALVLILWLRHEPITRARILPIVPFIALSLAMGLVTLWWERTQQGTHAGMFSHGILDRLLIATRAAWFYLGKLLWPADLSFSYPLWTINAASPLAYLPLLADFALIFFLLRLRPFAGRGPETAALFFIAMLSPLLGFIMLYTFRYSYVADHYAYIASIGPLTLLAVGLTKLLHRLHTLFPLFSTLRVILPAAILLTLATLTWRQAGIYENLETLWRDTIAKNPDSYIAHNNLSAVLLEKRDIPAARLHAEKALSLNPQGPDLALALVNVGTALLAQDLLDNALAHFQRAIAVQPNYPDAHNNLGSALLNHGRDAEAEPHFLTALRFDPNHANAQYNLGLVLLNRGDLAPAIARFEKSLALRPDAADAHNDLGTALILSNRLDEARPHFERALTLRPGFAQAHNNLAFVLLRQGHAREALPHFRSALKLQPDNARTHAQLAWVLATWPDDTLRNGLESLTLAQHAATLAPDDPLVLRSLAAAHAETGRLPEAIAALQRALALSESNPAITALLQSQISHYRTGAPLRTTGP
jgi:tetratricopeptide (TPR) repeat protein